MSFGPIHLTRTSDVLHLLQRLGSDTDTWTTFLIGSTHMVHTDSFQVISQPFFCGNPLELELVTEDVLLGFHISTEQLTFRQPPHPTLIRSSRTAGSPHMALKFGWFLHTWDSDLPTGVSSDRDCSTTHRSHPTVLGQGLHYAPTSNSSTSTLPPTSHELSFTHSVDFSPISTMQTAGTLRRKMTPICMVALFDFAV